MIAGARQAFRGRFHREPEVAAAPGRVNLIGEHTDYNAGFVLPMAVELHCIVAFSPNRERLLRGYSLAERSERTAALDELEPSGSWMDYASGVVWAHREAGVQIPGMDFVVGGNLPIGAGLSSSAAFELATARAVVAIARATWQGEAEARLAQRAENEFVGVPCGIMDSMAVSVSREGCAMLLDCRSLEHETVPLSDELRAVILDTGTRRALAETAYPERRQSCERAASILGLAALRDADRKSLQRLSGTLARRAKHVVEENERTVEMARALGRGDHEAVGHLMRASHESLRDGFEVSSPALDAMVEIAGRHPAAVGARMTGAGFGGCAVALVRAARAEEFRSAVERAYRRETKNPGRAYVSRAVAGARLVDPAEIPPLS